jgi:predicted N-acetyltransferase YhbS
MPPAFTLRPAVLADIPALNDVGHDADQRYVDIGYPAFAEDTGIPTAAAEKAIAEGRITVAEHGGQVVGWVYVGRVDGELCIGQISVARAYGGRGLGTALLRSVIDAATARGEPCIVLNTQSDVAWNRPWYERHGFCVVARDQWTPALTRIAEEQSNAGLDWSTRVHMRLTIAAPHPARGAEAADTPSPEPTFHRLA